MINEPNASHIMSHYLTICPFLIQIFPLYDIYKLFKYQLGLTKHSNALKVVIDRQPQGHCLIFFDLFYEVLMDHHSIFD